MQFGCSITYENTEEGGERITVSVTCYFPQNRKDIVVLVQVVACSSSKINYLLLRMNIRMNIQNEKRQGVKLYNMTTVAAATIVRSVSDWHVGGSSSIPGSITFYC